MSPSRFPARYIPWAILMLALVVRLLTAWPFQQPGYTDAYYYAVGAQQLDAGQGFDESFIWNYLNPPQDLPHPGYLYWMPLAAMLGWLGRATLGDSFWATQVPFVLVSALLPLVSYGVAWDLTGKRQHAVLAGVLTIFPGFYAHMFVLPDNFAPFALAGSLCLWAAGRGLRDRRPLWFGLAGLSAGFGHLARADGMLLAAVVLLMATVQNLPQIRTPTKTENPTPTLASIVLVVGGYLLVMGPWFVRNWLIAGSPLAPGGTKTMFLTTYDDMFAYGKPLTLQSYLDWGWEAIVKSKWEALWRNLQRLWVENLLIFLLPFTAIGLWQLRRERLLWPFFLYFPLLFLAMTLVFTFPGMRGGLFHSGGVLLPFFFAAAGPGLQATLRWAVRRFSGWHVRKAWPVFSAGMVILAMLLTVFAMRKAGVFTGSWNERERGYTEIGTWLAERGEANAIIMVGNAPGFTWHTGHNAIAVPNDPLDTILDVADRYSARYLVLDSTRPRTTDALYRGEQTHQRLVQRYKVAQCQVYEIKPPDQYGKSTQ